MTPDRVERVQAMKAKLEQEMKSPGTTPERMAECQRGLKLAEAMLSPPKASRPLSPDLQEQDQQLDIPLDQRNEPPSNSEPGWSAARWWAIGITAALSVVPILEGPTWQKEGDPEAKLGLLIYGPLVVALLVTCGVLLVEAIFSRKDRAEWLDQFAITPFQSLLGLGIVFVSLAFLGLIVLGGMGFGPDRSNWYIWLPAALVVLLVIRSFT